MLISLHDVVEELTPSFRLYYSWTGWVAKGFRLECPRDETFSKDLRTAWEGDGIRLLEWRWRPGLVQILVSVKPDISPVFVAQRLKGRLAYALRLCRKPARFQRNFSIRSIGKNNSAAVEKYIERQVENEAFIDSKMDAFMQQFTVVNNHVDLSIPTRTRSGQYWYNLHLVLVTRQRSRAAKAEFLGLLRDGCFEIAEAEGHRISRVAVMLDHLHMALRAHVEKSPEDVALAFMRGLEERTGVRRLWPPSYYVGSFSEYDLGAVRRWCDWQVAVNTRDCGYQCPRPAGRASRGAAALPVHRQEEATESHTSRGDAALPVHRQEEATDSHSAGDPHQPCRFTGRRRLLKATPAGALQPCRFYRQEEAIESHSGGY